MRERRSSPRYTALRIIELRWETGEVFQAWLEDFSVGGALVRVDTRPPRDQKVSVCITDGECDASVDGTIIQVSKVGGWIRRASFVIRIKFSKSCPYDFFKDNVFSSIPPPEISPEYESYWR
jgi:hypothetical protein